jgi:hypothetical protein
VHWSFAVQDAPAPPIPTQVPLAPGFWQKSALLSQSLSELHDDKHWVAFAHFTP